MKYKNWSCFNNKGFTLIEVILYIGLFSLLMGTAFVTIYQLIDGSGDLSIKTTIQDEGNFVMRKIDWALTGLDPTSTPSITGPACSKKLDVTKKTEFTTHPVSLQLNNVGGINYIEIQKNGGTFYPITTENVKVTCLKFVIESGTPSGITATATINGIDFNITKYLRK